MARPICLRLFMHWVRAADSRTFCTAGTSRPIRMAMMAITTSSSMRVKAGRGWLRTRFMGNLQGESEVGRGGGVLLQFKGRKVVVGRGDRRGEQGPARV